MCGFVSGHSVPFHWSIFALMPVPHCFDYCRFLVSCEIRKYESVSFILFKTIWVIKIPFEFQDGFSISVKTAVQILKGIALSLQIALGSTVILTILSLPIQEHERSSCLFRSSLILSPIFYIFQYPTILPPKFTLSAILFISLQ